MTQLFSTDDLFEIVGEDLALSKFSFKAHGVSPSGYCVYFLLQSKLWKYSWWKADFNGSGIVNLKKDTSVTLFEDEEGIWDDIKVDGENLWIVGPGKIYKIGA